MTTGPPPPTPLQRSPHLTTYDTSHHAPRPVAAETEPTTDLVRADRAQRDLRTRALLEEAGETAQPERRARLRELAVLENRDLALRIAHRYRSRGVESDDLDQVALLALVKAIIGYRPHTGVSFAAYAIPTISGELRRHFRDHAWAVRPPRRLQELSAQVRAAEAELGARLGAVPSVSELAHHLEVTPDDVRGAQEASGSFHATSLDAPVGEDRRLGDVLVARHAELDRIDNVLALRQAVARLPERERRVLALRYGLDMTQAAISREVGVSQMHVSRILAKTLMVLRAALTTEAAAS